MFVVFFLTLSMNAHTARRLMFWGGIILALAVAVFLIVKNVTYDPTSGKTVAGVSSAEWTKGAQGMPILMEYSDFQCPACGAYYPLVKRLVAEFGMRVQFVYRHFPLGQIHAHAFEAAYAAEAAGRQGKFWDMHDVIFEKQKEWSGASDAKTLFVQYAQGLGLNVEQFTKDMGDSDIKDRVQKNYKSGEEAGVPGTPTFFFDGRRIQPPANYEAFKAILNYELGKK